MGFFYVKTVVLVIYIIQSQGIFIIMGFFSTLTTITSVNNLFKPSTWSSPEFNSPPGLKYTQAFKRYYKMKQRFYGNNVNINWKLSASTCKSPD